MRSALDGTANIYGEVNFSNALSLLSKYTSWCKEFKTAKDRIKMEYKDHLRKDHDSSTDYVHHSFHYGLCTDEQIPEISAVKFLKSMSKQKD
eukprot:Pgem_evm2s15834